MTINGQMVLLSSVNVTLKTVTGMTDFACFPPCIGCRQADACVKPEVAVQERRALNHRIPSFAEMYGTEILLPCGCCDIPWPLFHVLGDSFDSYWCERHLRWIKLTQKTIKEGRKLAAGHYARWLAEQTGYVQSQEPLFL